MATNKDKKEARNYMSPQENKESNMSHQTEWEKRFEDMTPNTIPVSNKYSLYGDGSVDEWLKNNSDKHLYVDTVYGEPMFDLSKEKVKAFIATLLAEERERGRKNGLEEARKVTHNTEDGWCCACDYDILELENRIANEREKVVEILEAIDINKPGEFGDGYKFAINKALLAIKNKEI